MDNRIQTSLISEKDLELIENANIDKSVGQIAYQSCYAAICLAHDFSSDAQQKSFNESYLKQIRDLELEYGEDDTYATTYLSNLKKKYSNENVEDLLSSSEAKLIKKECLKILRKNPIDVNGDLILDEQDADLLFKICYTDFLREAIPDENDSMRSTQKAISFFSALGSCYANDKESFEETCDMVYQFMFDVVEADNIVSDSEKKQLQIIKDTLFKSNPTKGNIDNLYPNFHYLKSVKSIILEDNGIIIDVDENGDWERTYKEIDITEITNYEWFESLNQDEIAIVEKIKNKLKNG